MFEIFFSAEFDAYSKRWKMNKKQVYKLQKKVEKFTIKNYQNPNLDDAKLESLTYTIMIGLLEQINEELEDTQRNIKYRK